ncbi:hypothetical protein FDP41_009840 [Naegleria fowleri]|uniref:Complex 1 LYR protein domain-containing protein n=1 Tax=Naegleria fowleri TaxID=5763 RepID=A0A6A5AY67_NAEFO|nr:uncharacterized protein FDP41_009840 [Naegleria fowleri]KAF0971617.1 hypothetical protein FDP41_009840 [Naegleria fowleri]CAG4709256.1 unnamed protein product [Naegleria fowleri]
MNTSLRSANRSQILILYRKLLRVGYQWPRWEDSDDGAYLGDFILEKTKKEFRKNINVVETGPLLERARRELRFLQTLQADIFKKQFVLKRNYSESAEEIDHSAK